MFPALTHVSILSSQAFRHLEPIRFASITFDMERSRLISNKTNDCVWSLSIKDRITKCGTVMSRDRERKELPLDEIKREKFMQQNGNWDCERAKQPKTRLKCHHKPNTCTNAKRVNLIFGFGLFFSLSFLLVLCVCVCVIHQTDSEFWFVPFFRCGYLLVSQIVSKPSDRAYWFRVAMPCI